jgi:hypothetical protein
VIEERQGKNKVSKPLVKSSDSGIDKHWVNFVEVVKSRKTEDLHCSIQAGAHVATEAQMGNISFRTGILLAWDRASGKFTDQAVNDAYLLKQYHNGYSLPKI